MRFYGSAFLFSSVRTTLGHCWDLVIIVFLPPNNVMGRLVVGKMCFLKKPIGLEGNWMGVGNCQEGSNMENA